MEKRSSMKKIAQIEEIPIINHPSGAMMYFFRGKTFLQGDSKEFFNSLEGVFESCKNTILH